MRHLIPPIVQRPCRLGRVGYTVESVKADWDRGRFFIYPCHPRRLPWLLRVGSGPGFISRALGAALIDWSGVLLVPLVLRPINLAVVGDLPPLEYQPSLEIRRPHRAFNAAAIEDLKICNPLWHGANWNYVLLGPLPWHTSSRHADRRDAVEAARALAWSARLRSDRPHRHRRVCRLALLRETQPWLSPAVARALSRRAR